jgi:hypothetical protein
VTEETQAHGTNTSMAKETAAEFDAGADIALKVKVGCSLACDLIGGIVRVIAQDAVVAKETVLTEFDGTVNETDELLVNAPNAPGEYTWAAVFPAQEMAGILHQESSAPFSFIVKPHAVCIEIWDVPSPIALGDQFKIKVGVTCSAGCGLSGKGLEIYDHDGVRLATGTLGDMPWSTTGAQSCAEVELKAPGLEGRYTWEAKFPQTDMELPHELSARPFAFGVAGQPEHVVTVEVIDRDTGAPIGKASVVLRPSLYRGSEYVSCTDDVGVAELRVPKGEYHICATTRGYKSFSRNVDIASDTAVKAELLPGSDLDDIYG